MHKKLVNLIDYRLRKNKDGLPGIKGMFEVSTKDGRKLFTKDNLIVYVGREIFAQKLFNFDRTGNGEQNLFISWMSVGTGGADPADPLTPVAPTLTDTSLNNEIVIDATDPTTIDGGRKKKFNTLEILQDTNNDNKYLIVKATMILERDQANGANLNEAGLWLCNSDDVNQADTNTLRLASRITFPTIVKNNQLELILAWYYFL